MACSNPLKLYEKDLKPSLRKNHANFTTSALRHSFNQSDYFQIPCRFCLNCRVDRQNELVDRCEYEYINFGCGAFVTFTYDDVHLAKNQFIDSHSGELTATINKKDGKDFLNRLNKLVHAEYKKNGYNPLCRTDYKYVLTHEYGDQFQRPHIHCLFFGLDFAYCERLFWRAWRFQGSIEVGAIKNGGIAYAVKYISDQSFGTDNFFKYTYHHLEPPCSSHSIGLGSGLYKGQLKYIREHDGMYRWHGKDRPVPTYWKNKFLIISDLDEKRAEKRYKANCDKIYSLYEHRIVSYKDFEAYNVELAKRRQKNLEVQLHNQGKQVYSPSYIQKQIHDLIYKDNHRLHTGYDNWFCRVLRPDGTSYCKIGERSIDKLKVTDLMKLHTDYKHLVKMYGLHTADKMLGLPDVPF